MSAVSRVLILQHPAQSIDVGIGNPFCDKPFLMPPLTYPSLATSELPLYSLPNQPDAELTLSIDRENGAVIIPLKLKREPNRERH